MKRWLIRIGKGLAGLLTLGATLALVEYSLGQPMGLFAGSRPAELGFREGKFKPCPWKPNCVSSTADPGDATHYIAPLAFSGPPDAAWQKLKQVVANIRNTTTVTDSPDYLYVEFKSAGLGFVDDVEFALDAKASVIQVRSASRLGIRDLGVNRKRIENIRTAYSAP